MQDRLRNAPRVHLQLTNLEEQISLSNGKDKKKTEIVRDDSTRDRILLAAGPIFAGKGFRSATVREICVAAQVNVASINYYFGDKQQLYTETVVMARQMRAQQFPYPDWDQTTSAEEKLHGFVSLLLNRLVALQTEPWQVRLLMREILQPTEACKKLVKDYFRPFFDVLLVVVDELIGFRLPDHQRNKIGFSIIGQCLYYRIAADVTAMFIETSEDDQQDAHYEMEQLADHVAEFSLGAIQKLKQSHQKKQEELK